MSGKLIVFEGMDCTGKTTTVKKLLNQSGRFVYNKGIGSEGAIGRFSRKFPSTFMFFLELMYFTFTRIKPELKKEKIILQDRYDISITSYVPVVERLYNKVIVQIFRRFVVKPAAIVYFYLPLNEHLRRLRQKSAKYELILANNPRLIQLRKKKYSDWYKNFDGQKIKIDTQKNNLEETIWKTRKFIEKIL
ncbi:hypothetical protein J4474_02815 [Candidatus Pacearchaeota archaeon]|nr:hypothetical protein [Candidatus Pacearchaeota archaeon]